MALNPEILGRPLFPSAQRTGELLGGFGKSLINAFTPAAGTPPATMAGVSIPPAGASLSQLQFNGPLLGTGPMFGIRGTQQAAPQPAQPSFDYGTYAATRGLPSFDVTKTQTPFSQYSASASQQMNSSLAGRIPQQPQMPTQAPIFPTKPQEPRIATAVREGTISATPQQLANFNARTTAFEGRTPEQQQALLAQMRERGSQMAGAQERFFTQKREEREALRGAEASAAARGVRPMDIMKARELSQPSTLAGIRGQAYQYTQRLPMEGVGSSAVAGFQRNLPVGGSRPLPSTGLGPSGYALYEQEQAARRARGITGPYSNTRAEQRRATREVARSLGVEPALSRGEQQKQEDYFRSRNLM